MSTPLFTKEEREALVKVFGCIDNTTLEGCDTHEKVERLCRRSMEMQDAAQGIVPVAAVCVYPVFVRQACQLLHGTGIHVAAVAGAFPSGQAPLPIKLQEVRYALDEGADEIDTVILRGALIEGDENRVFDELAAIREASKGKCLKVILETGELPSPTLMTRAAELSIEAGADFIKTSTGKIAVSATPEAAQVMLSVIEKHHENSGKWVGFKAAGGISTPEEALKYYQLAAAVYGEKNITKQYFRIGASRLTERIFSILT